MDHNPAEPKPTKIAPAIFLTRLSNELEGLGSIASDLQEAIHNLPLEGSDGHTRQVLQSADKLTQSLVCLSAAVDGISHLPSSIAEYDLSHVLQGVFLEDLRDRLMQGKDAAGPKDRGPPGRVEFF